MSEIKEMQSASKQPDVLSKQYIEASKLHQHIIASAELAQQNIIEMCQGLKKMRDGKAYTAFGYETFEDYCENMVGMKRSNAYKYITIVENLSEDKIQTYGQIGISKLSLLASLSHVEQDEIVNVVDVNNVSYRELQAKIKEIEKRNNELENKYEQTTLELSTANERIEELENRPVEVSVQEDTESKKRAEELEKQLSTAQKENEKLSESVTKLKDEHAKAEAKQKEDFEKEHLKIKQQLQADRDAFNQRISSLQNEVEKARTENKHSDADNKEIFKAYYKNCIGAFNSMIEFVNNISSDEAKFCSEKIKILIKSFEDKLEVL
ncbi:hypothetical protein [Pseudoruminococcus massiliensis]|uniref:hypothetical protein n=1 Tax=Pseudoruminococcus massiliensis TaxID=2086583 RepID=UPI000D113C9B|nr:hypothetical protein [Pseudoruminococcus massiliensis]